ARRGGRGHHRRRATREARQEGVAEDGAHRARAQRRGAGGRLCAAAGRFRQHRGGAHRGPGADGPGPMRISHFFIDRPVFAGVIAILITLAGLVTFPGLPVAQYPDISPPTVNISAAYPGANAETLADAVAAPLEQSINGVENMIYMSSQSTGDGHVGITVTFKLGTDPNAAQVLVD